jgi:hypothetical protein
MFADARKLAKNVQGKHAKNEADRSRQHCEWREFATPRYRRDSWEQGLLSLQSNCPGCHLHRLCQMLLTFFISIRESQLFEKFEAAET